MLTKQRHHQSPTFVVGIMLVVAITTTTTTTTTNAFAPMPLLAFTKPTTATATATTTTTTRIHFQSSGSSPSPSSTTTATTPSSTSLFDIKIAIPAEQETASSSSSSSSSSSLVQDVNGKDIEVGSVVRVVVDNLRAFQVGRKMFGSFNQEGEFVPLEDDNDINERNQKSLVIPVGLRGVVQYVYDENEVSSNLPIKTLFEPDCHNEERNSPGRFIMHFASHEVQVVE